MEMVKDIWGFRNILNYGNYYYSPNYKPKWWNISERIKAWWYWRQRGILKEKDIQRVMEERDDDRTGAIQFIEYCDKIQYEHMFYVQEKMREQLFGTPT